MLNTATPAQISAYYAKLIDSDNGLLSTRSRRSAAHEAGHAVLEFATGNRIIEIFGNAERWHCRAEQRPDADPNSRETTIQRVCALLAGHVSEQIWELAQSWRDPVPTEFSIANYYGRGWNDLKQAVDLLRCHEYDDLAVWAMLSACHADVWRLLLNPGYRRAADNLGCHLHLTGRVDGALAHKIISREIT